MEECNWYLGGSQINEGHYHHQFWNSLWGKQCVYYLFILGYSKYYHFEYFTYFWLLLFIFVLDFIVLILLFKFILSNSLFLNMSCAYIMHFKVLFMNFKNTCSHIDGRKRYFFLNIKQKAQDVFAVQLLSRVWLFATHGLQHARLPCPSLSPKVCSNSCTSHPLLPPSPPALNLSQHQGLFQWVSSSH